VAVPVLSGRSAIAVSEMSASPTSAIRESVVEIPVGDRSDATHSPDSSDSSDATHSFVLGCVRVAQAPGLTDIAHGRHRLIIYLHGFPDQSVSHQKEQPATYGRFSSRIASKMADHFCGELRNDGGESGPNREHTAAASAQTGCGDTCGLSQGLASQGSTQAGSPQMTAFLAFNFRGTPGSSGAFFDKTVSGELADLVDVVRWAETPAGHAAIFGDVRLPRCSGEGVPGIEVHVVGLSTGAIIGALARRSLEQFRGSVDGARQWPARVVTVSVLAACGVDIRTAFRVDFSEQQEKEFLDAGRTQKAFWLPLNSPSNPPEAVVAVDTEGKTDGTFLKHEMALGNTRFSRSSSPGSRSLPSCRCALSVSHVLRPRRAPRVLAPSASGARTTRRIVAEVSQQDVAPRPSQQCAWHVVQVRPSQVVLAGCVLPKQLVGRNTCPH